VPEVQLTALYLAYGDHLHLDDRGFDALWMKINQDLLRSPLYRVLMVVASPSMVLKGTERRWKLWHLGVTLQVTQTEAGKATATMGFPKNLLPRRILSCYGTAFYAAIEAAGGKKVTLSLLRSDPLSATYEATWS